MPTPSQINSFFEFAARQLNHLLTIYPDRFPMYTTAGKWDLHGESWTNWCEGFLCGQLWLLYQHTHEPAWHKLAEHYCRLIEPRKTDRSVHDLGFIFWPSWKRWYDLTGDPAINAVVIQAGQTLAERYQDRGRYLCSFLGPNSLFIDIMMNVGIIFYAANQLGDPNLERIARQHCSTTRKYLVRGDGSTAHEGIFDPETGQFLHPSTQQGWRCGFVLGARPGLGSVWVYYRLRNDRRPPFSGYRRAVRRLTTSNIPPNTACPPTIGMNRTPPCLMKARPPPLLPAVCSTWRACARMPVGRYTISRLHCAFWIRCVPPSSWRPALPPGRAC